MGILVVRLCSRDLLTSRSMAIWSFLWAGLSAVDGLEADRLAFHYRITARVWGGCVSKLWTLSRSYDC